jgi:hypothetical protein
MLVGDVVMMVRELITDVPQAVGAPTITPTVVSPAGNFLALGTYFLVVTAFTPWGESSPSAESSALTVGANQSIQVAVTLPVSPNVIKYRVYITSVGGAAGAEQFYFESTSATFTILGPVATLAYGTPPIHSSAYLPDTDGGAFSAGSLFRWLSQGLTECSRIAGGIMDYTGVGTVQGQPLYVMPGEWQAFADVWYDGYPVSEIGRSTMFRRSAVTSSILGAVACSVRDNRVILEVWPQPARTAVSTTTTASFTTTDTSINVTSTAGFVLPFGFAQLGPVSPSTLTEVVSYSSLASGTSLAGCVRALSGGVAISAAASGVPVKELNLFMNGKRIFTTPYVPGQSATVIPVPAGWDDLLVNFMLSKAKQAEQDFTEAARLKKAFDEQITGWARTNRQLAGPRQVQLRDDSFSIANPHPFGGTVLP